MSYSLDSVISECLTDKLMSKTAPRDTYLRDHGFYKDCWDSMNKWIESRLRKNKGASISNLGDFNWDFREVDGEKQCRPIFIVSDSFVKENNVQRPKTRFAPILSKTEEINYSKLAIKFSKSLTKDMIFSGLRDIFHKIGEYVKRSYEFSIEFSFGTLLSKERRIRFDFNFLRLTQILPENMVGQARAEQMGLSKHTLPPSSSAKFPRRTPAVAGAKLPKMQSSPNMNLTADSTANFSATSDSFMEREEEEQKRTDAEEISDFKSLNLDLGFGDQKASSTRPISPGLQAVLQSMDPPSPLLSKKERHSLACQSVSDQAFRRCLFNVSEGQRHDENVERSIIEYQLKQELKEQKKRQKQLEEVSDLQKTLNLQMENKRQLALKPQTASSTSLQLEPSEAALKEKEGDKHELLRLLNEQIEDKRYMKEKEKLDKLSEESRFLEHVAVEFDVQNTVDRVRHLEQQRALLDDWERAAHIRNLQKLKGTDVVHKYVSTNFANTAGVFNNTEGPETGSRESSRGFGMSIGYDSRR